MSEENVEIVRQALEKWNPGRSRRAFGVAGGRSRAPLRRSKPPGCRSSGTTALDEKRRFAWKRAVHLSRSFLMKVELLYFEGCPSCKRHWLLLDGGGQA